MHHDSANHHKQSFDTKGHPQNSESQALRRRLIRAQNDALSTVGVVVRKARMNQGPWQTMSDEDKYLLLLDENIAGANCGIVESVLRQLSTRWIETFRRRMLVGLSAKDLAPANICRLINPTWACLYLK